MHMANELLNVPVAAGTCAIAAGWLGFVCNKAKKMIDADKIALMGILGAFVFAAQMINFQLPAMPGTSGHLVGAVLLAIILGPWLGSIVISSVIIIQCLIFQDGGLLALGCNLINMAFVPSFLGYFLYSSMVSANPTKPRVYFASIISCLFAILAGAVLVPIEAVLSGIIAVPFSTFLITMVGVHLLVGIIEGFITAVVLVYLTNVRPDILDIQVAGRIALSKKALYASLIAITFITAAILSLFASGHPDGLEWTYADRPDQQQFQGFIANQNPAVELADNLQSKYTILPDYSIRQSKIGSIPEGSKQESWAGWTSFAGVIGSAIIMFLVWGLGILMRNKKHALS